MVYPWCWLLVFLQLTACSSLPSSTAIPLVDTPHRIYFIYTGWHTSLLLAAKPLLDLSPQLAKDFHGQEFVRVGWGDGDYFTGKSKHWMTATKALVASDYSALQVLVYNYDPRASIPVDTRVALAISDQGLEHLALFIEQSIARNEQGEPEYLPPSKMNDNVFYRAQARYGLFNNCNTWSSLALRAAGLPTKSRFQLTAQSVFKQAKFISAYQHEQGVILPNEAPNQ